MRLMMTSMVVGLCAVTTAVPSVAAGPSFPVIKGYGGIETTEGAAERPDKSVRYRVIFNVTKGPAAPGKINPTLDRIARFINLLGADGVRPAAGDLVAIVHGPATALVMDDASYRAKFGVPNPNLELIERFRQNGTEVRVCSQALASNKIARKMVNPAVQVDVSAMTTLANLQLKEYALIPD